jgi:hypothetical protein
VVVAGINGDYLLRNDSATTVTGPAGAPVIDLSYIVSPQYPASGAYSPALLVAEERHSRQLEILRCTAVFKCTDGTALGNPAEASAFTSASAYLLASQDYASDGTVFAATSKTIAKSTDGGATFKPLTVVAPTTNASPVFPMMALSQGYREGGPVRTAYVAVFRVVGKGASSHTDGGVYRSSDGGATWAPLAATGPFAGGASAVAVAPDGRLFAGYLDAQGRQGLLCSTDGSTWRASCPSAGTEARKAPPCSGTACPVGAGGAVYLGGSSTTPVSARDAAQTGTSGARWGLAVAGAAVIAGLILALAVPRWRSRLLRPFRSS